MCVCVCVLDKIKGLASYLSTPIKDKTVISACVRPTQNAHVFQAFYILHTMIPKVD